VQQQAAREGDPEWLNRADQIGALLLLAVCNEPFLGSLPSQRFALLAGNDNWLFGAKRG
jgi:hypothetical protein